MEAISMISVFDVNTDSIGNAKTQDCIFGLDGGLYIHNTVIVVVSAELQPIAFS